MAATTPPVAEIAFDATQDELVARWIEPDPRYPTPERAWIRDHPVSVAAVIGRWQAAGGDIGAVVRTYRVPAEAVAAALAYYRQHQKLLDARIVLNAKSFPIDPSRDEAFGDELIARWIEPDPRYPTPERAWIRDHPVSVAAVIGRWQAAGGDVGAVVRTYRVPAEAIAAALAYYRQHQELLDARITLDMKSFPE